MPGSEKVDPGQPGTRGYTLNPNWLAAKSGSGQTKTMSDKMLEIITIAPSTAWEQPQYARPATVERLYGIKRGSLYNLLAAKKIRGCALRITTKRSRTRLIELQSVRDYIASQMEVVE